MSFKVKRWGLYGSVNVQDYYPGALSSYNPSPEHQRAGLGLLFAGKILFLCYDASGEPIWFTFDPAGNSFAGPFEPPSQVAAAHEWYWWSAISGWDRSYRPWGETDLVCYGMPTGAGISYSYFYGWDSDLNLWEASNPEIPGGTFWRFMGGLGCYQGEPARYVYVTRYGYAPQLWIQGKSANTCVLADASNLYIYYQGGVAMFDGTPWEGLCSWGVQGQDWPISNPGGAARSNIFGSPPLKGGEANPLVTADASGTTWQGLAGDAYVTVGLRSDPYPTISTYHALASDVSTAVTLPSIWNYRKQRDGLAYTLDEEDLDGELHDCANLPVSLAASRDVSFNSSLGIYIGVAANVGALTATIYGLDPYQPVPLAEKTARLGSEAIAWAGEYAIRSDLTLDHVLPMPEGYWPLTTGARPPEERTDGYILTNKHVYKRQGNAITLVGPLKVDLTSYPYADENWNWPGSESGYYAGFWETFAGMNETVLGRMPDSMFGKFFEGNDFMYGLGKPDEDLEQAEASGVTHVLSTAKAISGTSTFATPIAGGWSGLRRHLVAARSGDIYCYTESGLKLWAKPSWKAKAGRIVAGTWTSIVDFNSKGPPGLGETDWTVWSVTPIPPCRPLPQGGYLVGATLYFAPWASGAWEAEVGSRDATFRDTGNGWVPSLTSWDGPFRNDDNSPSLWAVTDPSQASRSLYGPDALLVYDHTGAFVECLNAATVYPPDGREITVTWEQIPKVIFRMYRWGTYSDDAEYLGQWHSTGGDTEIQAPLYCCYDLFGSDAQIKPGMGAFRGFVEAYAMKDYEVQSPSWRWSLPTTLYYYEGYMPGETWFPAGPWYLRAGAGGRQVVPLIPGPPRTRGDRPGAGHRTR